MWSKKNIPLLLVGAQTCTTTLEIGIVVSHKPGSQSNSRNGNMTLGHKPKGSATIPQGHLPTYVHSSIFFVIARNWKDRIS